MQKVNPCKRLASALFLSGLSFMLTSCGGSSAPAAAAVTLQVTPASTSMYQSYSSFAFPYTDFQVSRSDGGVVSPLTLSTTGGYCIVAVYDHKPGAMVQDVIGRCHPQCATGTTSGTITIATGTLASTVQVTCNVTPG